MSPWTKLVLEYSIWALLMLPFDLAPSPQTKATLLRIPSLLFAVSSSYYFA